MDDYKIGQYVVDKDGTVAKIVLLTEDEIGIVVVHSRIKDTRDFIHRFKRNTFWLVTEIKSDNLNGLKTLYGA